MPNDLLTPPLSIGIPMDMPTARRINSHMVAWYLYATLGLTEAPPPLTYTLAEMVEAAQRMRENQTERVDGANQVHTVLDDRAVAALYVAHHYKPEPNDAAGDPILSFPAPNDDGFHALLFLEFKSPKS